jgi:hypothetical protein
VTLWFGAVHYFYHELRERPDLAIGALRILARDAEGATAQGLLRHSDRWTRRSPISSSSLDRLAGEIAKQAYSHIVAYRGEKNRETATIGIDCYNDDPSSKQPLSVTLTLHLGTESDLAEAEELAHKLWKLFAPNYGISVAGDSVSDVQSELSTIPVSRWGAPDDPGNVQRLVTLQAFRDQFGEYTRDAEWGNYLGRAHVTALGGTENVCNNAPVPYALALPADSGVYLRLAARPQRLPIHEYRAVAARLNRFLLPVMVPELRNSVKVS